MTDPVNHPSHYTAYPVEVIQLTAWMNFCRGNAVKYIARAGLKDPAKEIEDLKKAAWYINYEIDRLEELKAQEQPVNEVEVPENRFSFLDTTALADHVDLQLVSGSDEVVLSREEAELLYRALDPA